MARHIIVFIATLVMSVLITGCAEQEYEYPELIEPVYLDIEPDRAEPDNIMLSDSITDQFQPDRVGIIKFQLDGIEQVVEEDKPEQIKTEVDESPQIKIVAGKLTSDVSESGKIPAIEPIDPVAFFHDKCSEIFNNYVDDKGMVDYSRLRRQRLRLKALIREFDTLNPKEYKSWTKENKIAFWLNAYNIQLLRIITDNYPIQSSRILRLYPGWGPNSILHIKGLWTEYKFLIMDEEFTLSEIDKRIFRKEFDDPRIFFAVFRGGLSGPPLRNEAYYGHRLNEQLNDQVKKFMSSPYALKVGMDKQNVYLSSLFQASSYGREFMGKFAIDRKFKDHDPGTRAVLNFITKYVSQDIASFLEVGNYSVKYMKYDWTINDGS
jgi:hypothetical protein